MTDPGHTLVALTAVLAVLVGVLAFALLRFIGAARRVRTHLREETSEKVFLTAALGDAVNRLKEQERAMNARAVASEQLSGQIVDSLTAGLLVVDGAGRVEILNPAARRLLGLSPDRRTGADYFQTLADVPPLVDVIAESLVTARAVVRRTLVMPAGVPASHLGVTVSPLPAGNGVICLFADLTNVFELEEQLRTKETLARLGELTAGIAHEFRNGLATIHGYSRLIDPSALPATYKPYIEGIRQETEALGRIVTNFLGFARQEQVVMTPVDVRAVATRAADDLRNELPEGTRVSVSGEFGEIQGDEVLLRQLFGNLIRNAAEACAAERVVPEITIGGQVDAQQRTCRVIVEDNGPGLPLAAGDRIFNPFFTTRPTGTGLGLAIVQKVVLTHNGRISTGRAATGGASFHLTFPLATMEMARVSRN